MVAWNFGDYRARVAVAGVAILLFSACVEKRDRAKEMAASSASSTGLSVKVPDVAQACTSICERSKVLRCKNADQCLVNCVAAASGTPCNVEFLAFYQCLVPQPIKNWECAEDGVAAIKPGICDKEQERAIQCMSKAQP